MLNTVTASGTVENTMEVPQVQCVTITGVLMMMQRHIPVMLQLQVLTSSTHVQNIDKDVDVLVVMRNRFANGQFSSSLHARTHS